MAFKVRTLELRKIYSTYKKKNRKQNDREMETNHLQKKVNNMFLNQELLSLNFHFFKFL